MEQTRIDTECCHDPERRPLRVLLATTWDTACGIAEHSRMLKAAVEAADDRVRIDASVDALNPGAALQELVAGTPQGRHYDLIHLNYHAALHAAWTPERMRLFRETTEIPIVVTYHDTGVPNSEQCTGVIAAADRAVVHEPFEDLPAEKTAYWRMGVPSIAHTPQPFTSFGMVPAERPYLGTVGFPFPWKCYDELAKVTAKAGWGLLLIAPGATPTDHVCWQQLNPWVVVVDTFLPQDAVIARLRACTATAFTYVCHNTGQSGAILQGIAARKPVIALRTCRQMRALAEDRLGAGAIHWAETFEDVQGLLTYAPFTGGLDHGIVALAEQESWRGKGAEYAALYRAVTR